MPELHAQLGGPDVVFAQYQFSEARRPQWEEFWRAHDGDLREIYGVAKDAMEVPHPEQFVAALHRFLFYTYPANTWLQRQALKKTAQQDAFQDALNSVPTSTAPQTQTPVETIQTVRPCPGCGSTDRHPYVPGKFHMSECAHCGYPNPDGTDPAFPQQGSVVITSAKPKSFLAFLRSIADTHDKEPMSKSWYMRYGTTPKKYIELLRLADIDDSGDDAEDDEYLMRRVNARIPDLGFQLYESYLLLVAPKAKAKEKEVLETLTKVAYEIEQAIRRAEG